MSREATPQPQQKAQSSTSHPLSTGMLQRKCTCGKGAGLTGRCSGCERQRLTLQRKAVDGVEEVAEVPPIVHEVLRSPGTPLDSSTRGLMESQFQQDFGHIQVYTDAKAAESAQAVNALAYTVGHKIVFGQGQFNPKTDTGKALLGHELFHTLQQQQYTQGIRHATHLAPPESIYERQADEASQAILHNKPVPAGIEPMLSGTLQRQVAGASDEVDLPARVRGRPQRQIVSPPSFRRLAREHPDIAQQLQSISRDTFNLVQTYRSTRIQRGVSASTASDSFFANAVTQWITYTERTIQQDSIDAEHLSEWVQLTQTVLGSLQPLLPRLNDRFAADAMNISRQLILSRAQRLAATELIETGRRSRQRRRREAITDVETTRSISEADLFARTSRDVRRYLSLQQRVIEAFPGMAVPQLIDLLVNRLGHNSERFQNFFEYLQSQQPDLFQQIQLEGRTIYDLQYYQGIEGIERYRIAGYHERTIAHIILGECGFNRETGSINEVTGVGIAFDVIIGLVPGLGQIADARDITCITYRFANYEAERSNLWSWFSLVTSLVGLLPGVGDAFKGLGRILQRYARVPGLLGESVLGRVLRFISDYEPELIARNAYALYLAVRRQWGYFTRLGITLFRTLLSRVFAGLSLLPRATIDLVRGAAHRMMPRAYEAAGVMFQQVLEGLALAGHRLAISAASRLRDLRSVWAASPFSTGTQRFQQALDVERALARLTTIERQLLETAADSPLAQRLYREFEETAQFVEQELGAPLSSTVRSDESLATASATTGEAGLRVGREAAPQPQPRSRAEDSLDSDSPRSDLSPETPTPARSPARASVSPDSQPDVPQRQIRNTIEAVDAHGERHGYTILDDGRIIRCSDECMELQRSLRERAAAIRRISTRASGQRRIASRLADEAAALRREARQLQQLPETERAVAEARLLARSRRLDREMSEVEQALAQHGRILSSREPDFFEMLRVGESVAYVDEASTLGIARRVDADTWEIDTIPHPREVYPRGDYQQPSRSGLYTEDAPEHLRGELDRFHAAGPDIGHESPHAILFGLRHINQGDQRILETQIREILEASAPDVLMRLKLRISRHPQTDFLRRVEYVITAERAGESAVPIYWARMSIDSPFSEITSREAEFFMEFKEGFEQYLVLSSRTTAPIRGISSRGRDIGVPHSPVSQESSAGVRQAAVSLREQLRALSNSHASPQVRAGAQSYRTEIGSALARQTTSDDVANLSILIEDIQQWLRTL